MSFDFFRYADDTKAFFLPMPQLVKGLPAVKSARQSARNPNIGATQTDLSRGADKSRWNEPVEVANTPSVKIAPNPHGEGIAVIIRLNSRYMDTMEMGEIGRVAEMMTEQMRVLSRGPYTTKMLREMQHPYGREKNNQTRKVARGYNGKSIGHVKGIRGSVPTLTVINSQRGELERAWKCEVERDETGVTILIINDTPYATFLALGTTKMQAHGPWSFVPTMFRSMMLSAWQKQVRGAWLKQNAESGVFMGARNLK